ncbi:FHA domain-containing protein [Archangium sp.]|uniref:FHA domain-containing protein n=1 Tax=Archangium sp. TaxID=1872627 RepID=UPI00389A4B9C
MAPPNRRPSRRPDAPSDESVPADSTRIKSANSVRRPAPQEEDHGASEEESWPAGEDTGDEGAYDDEGTPAQEEDDDNPDSTRAGPPLTLEIIEGPDKGRKKRFKGVRMVIGRGQDCELMLLDQSVSRRHVELVFGGENGVLLRDLVSGNGTRVNDARVDDCKLKHDDVIAIGRTRIRFVDEQERIKQMRLAAEEAERKEKEEAERKAREEEEAAKKAAEARAAGAEGGEAGADGGKENGTQIRDIRTLPRRNAPKSSPMGLMVAAGLVLLVALIGGGALFIKRGPPPPPPPNPKQEKALVMMQEAKTAFRKGDYAAAAKLADEADLTFPGVDKEGFLKAAQAEQAVVEAFAQVRQLAGESKFTEARELLTKTPHGTAQSTEELREKVDAEIALGELAFLVKQVEAALEAQDAEGARSLIQRLPLERQPQYLGKVAEVEAMLADADRDAAAQDRASKAAAARRAKEQREAFIVNAFSAVAARFDAGDYSRAALECDRVLDGNSGDKEIRERAKALKKLIPQFARFYQDAQRKMQSNSMESAARPLRSAAELYRQIGLKGSLGDTLNGQLASASVLAGKGALARNDVSNAAAFFNEALRLRPDDAKAQEGMAAIQGKLGDIFKQAYIQRDRDPDGSAEKFRMIARYAAEGSELKEKAEAQLQALDQ